MLDPIFDSLRARWATLPEPPLRAQWQAVSRKMRLHTRGADPRDVLLRRHRYEDDASLAWRLSNYQAITQPIIKRALTTLSRLLRDSEYDIHASEALTRYTLEPRFAGRDLYVYLQEHILPLMIEDPNGLLVWLPEGDGLHDAAKAVDVRPVYVASDDIRYQDADTLVFREAQAPKPNAATAQAATDGIARVQRPAYWLLSAKQIARAEPLTTASQGREDYRFVPVYNHNIGQIPALQLGGDWQAVGSDGYFDSFFSGFVAFGNEALRQFSDWQAVVSLNAYPIKELQPIVCDAPGCHHGQVTRNGETQTCSQCHGSGYVYHTGPFNALIRPEVNAALGETDNGQPLLRYITPPTEIIAYAQQAWELLLTKAEEALQLSHVREPQSGTAKAIDREELYGMLSRLAVNVFDHLLLGSLTFIEQYRNIIDPQPVRVVKPQHFALQSPATLSAELGAAQQAGLPQPLLAELTRQWASRHADGDLVAQKRLHILQLADPLCYLSASEKREWVRFGVVPPEAVQHSQATEQALAKLISANGPNWLLHTSDADVLAQVQQAVA